MSDQKPDLKRRIMPAFYRIDKERRLVLSTGAGEFSKADVLAHQEKLVNDPDFDPSFSQIADFTQVTELNLSAEDVRQLAEKAVFSPHSRRAIIAPNNLVFGLSRMFEILRENHGDMGIRAFRTLEEALDWVLSKGTAA